jgi:hypothetical protein
MGKRRRAPSSRVHSLVHQYGGRTIPKNARIAAIDIDDPYSMPADVEATLALPPRGARTATGPATWEAPPRPKIRVIAALRDEVAAKMFARHQIDRACFLAARDYQRIHELAAAVHVKSLDPSMPPISGGRNDDFEGVDIQRRAVNDLRRIEARVEKVYGGEGVQLVRDVLALGKPLERAAAERGDGSKQGARFLGGLFRRCLRCLAVACGFASAGAYGPP